MQLFLDSKFERMVRKLCRIADCDFDEAMSYYKDRLKETFGIAHLNLMLTPQNREEAAMKKMFCGFVQWFLRHRYMFYLLKFGKMDEKETYIQHKNRFILYIGEAEKKFDLFL